jgi:hypothetical protein
MVTITGVEVPIFVQTSGDGSPVISIDGSGWTTSGFIESGQTLQLQLTSGAGSVETSSALVTVGTSSAEWKVTTLNTACVSGSLGGYCWHAGATSQNCDTVCASYGGCDVGGLAYGEANNANCRAVLDSLSLGSGGVSQNGPWVGLGCFYIFGSRYRDFGGGATCAASYSGARRGCSCNT